MASTLDRVLPRQQESRVEPLSLGPWRGSFRSVSADLVPPGFMYTGDNSFYVPVGGYWRTRNGQTIQFDSLPTPTGLLPAKWSGKARQLSEFVSDAIDDSVPTLICLVTKETVASGLDDGRFSNVWIRDQVENLNYTIGAEYGADAYPAPGTVQQFRVVPLWYDSGDGGLTRGVTEFDRRFFFGGSRRFVKVGRQWYFPNLYGTPARWRGTFISSPSLVVAQRGPDRKTQRLFPSGPIPPTHSGTISVGTAIETQETIRPDSTISVSGWVTVGAGSVHAALNEVVPSTSQYMHSNASNDTFEVGMGNFVVNPTTADRVIVRYQATSLVASGHNNLSVSLMEGANVRAVGGVTWNSSTVWTLYSFELTPTEIGTVTNWNNVSLRFTSSSESGGDRVYVSWCEIQQIFAASSGDGGWRGKDRFYYAVAYRDEDGAVWMPCTPRAPNDTLPSGFNLFTVDASNPDRAFSFLTWQNLPIGPHGTTGRVLLRTPKIDSTTQDNLDLNPFDMRIVWEIQDNTTTTYRDSFGDDDALTLDPEKAIIRYDHMMPPSSRYVFAGDMRACHSYGRHNPCAIVIAPTGRAADFDLNVSDSTAAAYNQDSMYLRIERAAAGTGQLVLVRSDGAAIQSTLTLTFATYTTLQALVDRINVSAVATDGQQWRAQILPNVNPEASTLDLTPHIRTISGVDITISTDTLVKSAGGLSVVPVGARVSHASFPLGTYVTRIDSDTQLQVSANATATAAAATVSFYTELGDAPTGATANSGYQRVIANSVPAMLYFTKSYLNGAGGGIFKSVTWMTVASPGSVKSAPNAFSAKSANRHQPPLEAGISMGGGAVDQGFVLPFANKLCALRNTRDAGTGEDEDYRLFVINENRGCVAWNSVVPGNRFVPFFSPEGLCVADLYNDWLLSEAIFRHRPLAIGDFTYEAPLCVAASGKDDDGAYVSVSIVGSAIWVMYRASGTHPNRIVVYDFSSDLQTAGLAALKMSGGDLYGWSVPLTRLVSVVATGRRGDGAHIYGWNEQNSGSAGDGRIDELETGNTDNGVAVSSNVRSGWIRPGLKRRVAVQELTIEHLAPASSAGTLEFHRSYSDVTHSLSLSTGSADVQRQVKMLPQAARAGTEAFYVKYVQTSGAPRELRSLLIQMVPLITYK